MTTTGDPNSYSCGAMVLPDARSYFLIVKYSPSTAWISTWRGRAYGLDPFVPEALSIAQRVPPGSTARTNATSAAKIRGRLCHSNHSARVTLLPNQA